MPPAKTDADTGASDSEDSFSDARESHDASDAPGASKADAAQAARTAFTPQKLDRRELRAIAVDSEATFDADMADTERAVHLFLDSRVHDAERFLREKYCKTLPHTLGYAVILSLKCLMTFDRSDIDEAMDALRVTVEVAQAFRKEQTLFGSLTGFVFGGGRGGKDGSHFRGMTSTQRHGEVIFAEAHLLRAILSLLTDTNMVAFVREGLNIRQAYSIFKSSFRFLRKVWEEEGPEGLARHRIDANFINAVYHGIGAFNLVLSILPARVLRVFEMIGFGGHREFGMRCLELGADWPDLPAGGAAGSVNEATQRRATTSRKRAKRAIEFRMPDGSRAVTGIRTFLCDLTLHLYHVVLSSMLQMPGCNIPLAREMLARNLASHPDSFLYLTLQARLLQSEARPDLAATQLARVIDLQRDWRQLAHICFWDLGMCQNTWSPAIYLYLKAVFLYEHDPEGGRAEVAEMLARVPKLCKRVAGKSIPLEKFVARKSRKFHMQDKRLHLPGYEIMYMWNGFDHVPPVQLRQILARVDAAIKTLDEQLETAQRAAGASAGAVPYETYYDDVCLSRFFKGLALRELAFPTSATLVPEPQLLRLVQRVQAAASGGSTASAPSSAPALGSDPTPVQPERQVKDLNYAARQFEYIALQADQIHLDHWVLPFARYELGQLHVRMGAFDRARREYGAALSGGYADDEAGKQRRKASMENSLHLRVHNALAKLDMLEALAAGRGGSGAAGAAPDDADDDSE
ncbi:hypothetical protein HK105_205554 [Polyrhizophydium stewartii]|uniref:Uncharacterized protein n=1 Tax=Polyrhizophydium stewartii TaxID=2732419 RepID=A0ABR4N668_9FUNG